MSASDYLPRPPIKSLCLRCGVTAWAVDAYVVLVSATGKAHFANGFGSGDTACGIDATGDNWWWPL